MRHYLLCSTITMFLTMYAAHAQTITDANSDQTSMTTAHQQGVTKQLLPPKHQLLFSNLLGGRINPLGLTLRPLAEYRYRLFNSSNILLKDAFIGSFFSMDITPALFAPKAAIVIKPLSILKFTVGYSFFTWYGTFQYMASFPTATAEHSDSLLKDRKDAGLNYTTTGHELNIAAQLLGKVGPIVLRNDFNLYYTNMDLHDGDNVYYHISYDILMPNKGWAFVNDTDLVYLSDFGLVAGVRSTILYAFYQDQHFLNGETQEDLNTPSMRIGPLIAYTLKKDYHQFFKNPTLILIAQWHVKHRYRTGEDVSQALPQIQIAFSFKGDFFNKK